MTLTVGPDSLAAVARKPGLVAAFPFLAPLVRPRTGGCGGCGGAAEPPAWRAVTDALFALPPDRREAFKAAAGVTAVVRTVVRAGRVRRQTF